MILLGGMVSTAIIAPSINIPTQIISLPISLQIPGLLLCSLVFGPTSGSISVIAYLTLGLFFLPIFHGGGSIGYTLTPEFGYLTGFSILWLFMRPFVNFFMILFLGGSPM